MSFGCRQYLDSEYSANFRTVGLFLYVNQLNMNAMTWCVKIVGWVDTSRSLMHGYYCDPLITPIEYSLTLHNIAFPIYNVLRCAVYMTYLPTAGNLHNSFACYYFLCTSTLGPVNNFFC